MQWSRANRIGLVDTSGHRKRLDRTGQAGGRNGDDGMGWTGGLGEGESAGAWCWLAAVGCGQARHGMVWF